MSDDIAAACRWELECLWDDLSQAVRSALNGTWSMKCDSLEDRIKRLTPLVGPTRWEAIQIHLIESGVYQRIHSEIGVEVSPDMEQVAETRAYITKSTTRRS
jgi:hypothetical protein